MTRADRSDTYSGPIIDVHLHAFAVDQPGPGRPGKVPASVIVGYGADLRFDASQPWRSVIGELRTNPRGSAPFWASRSTEELRRQTLEAMIKLDIRGVVSGPVDLVRTYQQAAPDRVIPAIEFDLERFDHSPGEIADLLNDGFRVLGEITDQYNGTRMDDPVFDPYWQVAAERDVPVAIHTGVGAPGAPALHPGFRAELHSPLRLERLLNRHPQLRVWACHAAWPMLDELKAMLYNYPQLHIDTGALQMSLPRAEYYRFLEALVDAGFIDRIMYGTDQILWPELIGEGVRAITDASFLDHDQQAAILHHNAVRFLRLDPPQTAGSVDTDRKTSKRPITPD